MFDITKRTTITTDWAQLRTVQEKMNLAEIMLEVGSEFPICLEADADNENDVFEQLTAQVVHVTKEGRVMVVLKDCMEKMHAMNDYVTNEGGWKDSDIGADGSCYSLDEDFCKIGVRVGLR